jgi:hypothetical protein
MSPNEHFCRPSGSLSPNFMTFLVEASCLNIRLNESIPKSLRTIRSHRLERETMELGIFLPLLVMMSIQLVCTIRNQSIAICRLHMAPPMPEVSLPKHRFNLMKCARVGLTARPTCPNSLNLIGPQIRLTTLSVQVWSALPVPL